MPFTRRSIGLRGCRETWDQTDSPSIAEKTDQSYRRQQQCRPAMAYFLLRFGVESCKWRYRRSPRWHHRCLRLYGAYEESPEVSILTVLTSRMKLGPCVH